MAELTVTCVQIRRIRYWFHSWVLYFWSLIGNKNGFLEFIGWRVSNTVYVYGLRGDSKKEYSRGHSHSKRLNLGSTWYIFSSFESFFLKITIKRHGVEYLLLILVVQLTMYAQLYKEAFGKHSLLWFNKASHLSKTFYLAYALVVNFSFWEINLPWRIEKRLGRVFLFKKKVDEV